MPQSKKTQFPGKPLEMRKQQETGLKTGFETGFAATWCGIKLFFPLFFKVFHQRKNISPAGLKKLPEFLSGDQLFKNLHNNVPAHTFTG